MNNITESITLLDAAHRDMKALAGMIEHKDPALFSDEIFGYHVQQAIEKSLKAWLTMLMQTYPRTYDLSCLLKELEALKQDISDYSKLAKYNVFAGKAKYVGICEHIQIDRVEAIAAVQSLWNRVQLAVAA